jgi:probable rRNA maturation factor
LSIRIFYDRISFRQRGIKKIRNLIGKILERDGFVPGNINIIITDDESLIKINREFLKHDYYTDVITFGYNEEGKINGEIYISIDTVKNNALNYNVSLNNEMLRVIIHGILHLTGYDDKTGKERKLMNEMEDYWMEKLEG